MQVVGFLAWFVPTVCFIAYCFYRKWQIKEAWRLWRLRRQRWKYQKRELPRRKYVPGLHCRYLEKPHQRASKGSRRRPRSTRAKSTRSHRRAA